MVLKPFTYLLLIFSFITKAEINNHQIEIQHAGMIGEGHISYGIQVFDNHVFSLGIGGVRESKYHDSMSIYSVKYRYAFDKRIPFTLFDKPMAWEIASLSVTGIQGNDNQLYASLPDDIPDGYYFPSANRIVFGLQTSVHLNNKYQVYWDWSILDVGLINYVRNNDFYRNNYDFLGLEGIVTFGIGVRVSL